MKDPLISFCILSYNQDEYIEEAIKAAFNQNYSPLEIIISDDCSSDGTKEIIKRLVTNFKGDHQIVVNFNNKNLGLTAHFNKVCLELSRGEYIVIAAGDDISYPERTMTSYNFIKDKPEIYIADFNVRYINEEGKEIIRSEIKGDQVSNLLNFLAGKKVKSRGCSRIYRRKLFDIFGPINPKCPTEDSPSVVRGILLGPVWLSEKKVLDYRIHANSISYPKNLVKLNLVKIVSQYFRDSKVALHYKKISRKEYLMLRTVFLKILIKRTRKNLRLFLKYYFKI